MLIVANWKANPLSTGEVKKLFSVAEGKENVVICPPHPFLCFAENVLLGAQDCSAHKQGSFTGEVSPHMLKSMGCKYVIIGHSERRTVMGESLSLVNEKLKAAVFAGLVPILCVGETTSVDSSGGDMAGEEIKKQLLTAFSGVSPKKVVIAYEPIFSIGTGKPCPVTVANSRRILIKSIIAKKCSPSVAEDIPVLYGGSVTAQNVFSYVKEGGFQGVLIGKASLNISEFKKIIKNLVCDQKK